MPGTERLYYTDSYLSKMEARVTDTSEDGLHVRLEQTIFYPTSGGQPHDMGYLNDIAVVDVIDDGERITHVLAAPLAADRVTGEIDWRRRYDHMQQHTGQHLLSAVFEQLFQYKTLSFRMGEEASTIELAAQVVSQEQMDAVVLRATELARSNAAIAVRFEEAGEAQGLRKASEREGKLRIAEISGIDRSACGGTHVAGLAEILPLQMRASDRVRGNVRISFVCGDRAMAQSQRDFHTVSRAAKRLGCIPENVEAEVEALQQRLTETEKQKQRLESEAASRDGLRLYQEATPNARDIRQLVAKEAAINEASRTKAKAFTSQPKAIALLHSEESLLLACSSDSGINAGTVLKAAGARGGGSATLAQCGLPDEKMIQAILRAAGLDS